MNGGTNIQPIIFESKVSITISPQAQKIISSSKYNIEQFKEWVFSSKKFPVGGEDALFFLEHKFDEGGKL